MIEIEKPQIECVETPGDASYGKYGDRTPGAWLWNDSWGNALRRILLSSCLAGATSIKIAGVQHEFPPFPV